MRTSRITLLLVAGALVSGTAAAFLAERYVAGEIEAYRARLDAGRRPVRVLVANEDLPAGTPLGVGNVAVREVPATFVHHDAVRPEAFAEVEGRRLLFPLRRGETVLHAHLSRSRASGFSARVREGRRALTIPVDETSSFSGLLGPGDRIDLLVTLQDGDRPVTLPLLRDVQVAATGADTGDGHAQPEGYRTITVLVTPEEAARIVHAREIGKLTAMLRAPADDAPLHLGAVTRETLLGGRARVRARGDVEIIRGGVD